MKIVLDKTPRFWQRAKPLLVLVRVAALILCALTLAGYLGRFHWVPDACSHFRVQYVIALVVCSVLLATARDWRRAAIVIVFVAVNAVEVVPWYFGHRASVSADAPRLTLLCANVDAPNQEHERFLALVREIKPDLVVVIEVTPEWAAALEPLGAAYPHAEIRAREGHFGMALYSRLPLGDVRVESYGSAKVPSILGTVELDGQPVTLLATHPFPPLRSRGWRLRNEQLEAIAAARSTFGDRLIVAGDFNASPFSPCLKRFVTAMHTPETALRNARRGFGLKPTWPTFSRLMFIPIDHIFVTDTLVVTDFRAGPHIGSDHLPVQATIALGE